MRTPVLILFTLFVLCLAESVSAQACQATFSFGETGLTIEFTDESTSSPGDPVVSWLWDFGDGTTSTQQNPTHTFPDPGKYDVCLTTATQSGCFNQVCVEIETCVLTVAVNAGDCDANNEIPVSITVNDPFDSAQDINISVDGQLVPGSPFRVGADEPVTVNTTVPGDGLGHVINVQSEDVGTCGTTYTFTTPDCSSDCFLSSMSVDVAGGNTQIVQVGDNFFSPQNANITIGDVVEFQWVGDGHSTTSDATTGPDSWNSGVIGFGSVYTVNITNPGVHRYYCLPHGGPNGQGMSGMIVANCPASGQFSLLATFNTSIASPAGYNILLDGAPVAGGLFSYSGTGMQSNAVSIAGDGLAHVIEIQDITDPTCSIARTILAPDCGAAPACSISLTASQAGGCNASNQVPVSLSVTAINGGASGFNVYVDGSLATGGPYNYDPSGPTMVTANVPGDGQNHTIEARDIDDPACNGSTTLTTQDCNINCAITNLNVNTGSSVVHTVLVEDFAFNPQDITITAGDVVEWEWVGSIAHTATSDATSGPDSWDSGLLSQGATYQSPALSAGVHPYYCVPHGAPGGVGMAGTITVAANCTNNMVSLAVSFTASGGGFNGYEVLVDGSLAGSFSYDASGNNSTSVQVPGDGQSHTITVRDADDSACQAITTITTPDCNASTCQLGLSAQEAGGCTAGNEVPVELTVTDVGGGASGFEVLLDGGSAGTFSYSGTGTTVVSVNVIGDGQAHSIEVRDVDDPGCMASASVTTANCALDCMITNLELTTSGSGTPITHVVEVRDFDFFPAQLNVGVGDIVRFEWTGAVAHTSTSDATTGPDSWDSGLLGQGEVFEVTITTAGEHPYYCIPHGAPGGVGMAGMITASPPCDGGSIAINVSFESMGGSPSGYNIFLDGAFLAGPFAYNNEMGYNTTLVSIPGDSALHTLTVQDLAVDFCAASTTFTAPECDVLCEVTNLSAATGSDIVHTVYVEDFQFSPAELQIRVGERVRFVWSGQIPHTTTSDAVSGPDSWDSGLLGQGSTYELVITTPGSHPYYCIPHGGPGGIGMAGVIQAAPACVNDSVYASVSFEASSGSSQGYNLFIDGQSLPGNPYSYDDPQGSNQQFIRLPGDGATHLITVQDLETGFCAATVQLMVPDCNADCSITSLDVTFPEPTRHLVEVLDFEFSPRELTVTAGDTVEFFWTGIIPHTTTSDAASGVDSWDSGLLGQGDTYEVVIQEPGQHPYYCIPHGGPGGIGMAGSITALPGCQGDSVLANITFEAAGTGSGYLLLLDGVVAGQYTYQADGVNEVGVLLLGDGQRHELSIQDLDSPHCGDTLSIDVPRCAEACLLEATAIQSGACDENMEVPFELTVSGGGPENEAFQILVDGEAYAGGPYPYDPNGPTVVTIHLEGDGQTHQLLVEDVSDPGCAEAFELVLPNCLEPCANFTPAFSVEFDQADSLLVQFTDQTAGVVHQWLWGFGDGATSNVQHPFHTYDAPGIYTVCLLAQDTVQGCDRAICEELAVGVTGTREYSFKTLPLKILPNPARQSARRWIVEGIDPADHAQPIHYTAYGLRGERVAAGQASGREVMAIPLDKMVPAGIYILELRSPSRSYSGKVAVQ